MVKKENIYKVFSNKKRVELIMCLTQEKCVTDLLSLCTLSQSALSQHLKILKDADMVSCKREWKQQKYHVKNKQVKKIAELLLALENNI
ncbi:MAG: helix-turn-helix transcriptional regulator [Candidatus Pacebacteria bacterium]|nr:helix-turn-helix transcriptional regulator [Candidatus Paceibacterota bacterium]